MVDVNKCFTVPGEKFTWPDNLDIKPPADLFVRSSLFFFLFFSQHEGVVRIDA